MRAGLVALALLSGGAALAQGNARHATATLADPGGRAIGRATATQERGGVRVRIDVQGLAAGTHGAHIHLAGRCEGPAFESAGAHWNPLGRQHGSANPRGAHMGDLPNLLVVANGTGRLSFVMPQARLRGGEHPLLDADGAAVIVHAGSDDYRTDPSGNSGARIACGVLR